MAENLSFSCFRVIFNSYSPQFQGSGRFTRPVRPDTILKVIAENLLFSRFRAIFMSYSPQFGFLGQFTRNVRPKTSLRVIAENLSFSPFRSIFMSYSPQFWDSRAIHKAYGTRYRFENHRLKLVIFTF